MAKESLMKKVSRFNESVDRYIDKNLSKGRRLWLFVDFLYEYRFHGVYLQDYIQYEFYKKKATERKKYIVFGKLLEIMHVCNNAKHRFIFDEKPEFNKKFSQYIGRDWLSMDKATIQDFRTFLNGKTQIFVKDPAGMFGKGVELIKTDEIRDVDSLYKELKSRKALCEEVLIQCEETAAFNESSVNTMRVVTLVCADGTVKVMEGVLRIGRKGKFADNFHHNGIAALIDVETGLVKTTGVDRDFKRYVIHPDSGKPIVGFLIPEWDSIIETVVEAAKLVPDMRYIGWDVAVNKAHKIVLIEGNPGADPDVTQIPDQIGKWPVFVPLLNDIKRLKKEDMVH